MPSKAEERALVVAMHDLSQDIHDIEDFRNELDILELELGSISPRTEEAGDRLQSTVSDLQLRTDKLREKLQTREADMRRMCDTLRVRFDEQRESRREA